MLWLLKFLVLGHVHKWKEVSRVPLTSKVYHPLEKFTDVSQGVRVMSVCETCGAQKKWDLV